MNARERELRAVLETHRGMLRRIVASYERDPSLQNDLLQEVSLALWTALPRFSGAGSKRAFVARIAQNRAITHSVRRSKEPRGEDVEVRDDSPSIEDRLDTERRAARMFDCVREPRWISVGWSCSPSRASPPGRSRPSCRSRRTTPAYVFIGRGRG